jgi:hypothetical protein
VIGGFNEKEVIADICRSFAAYSPFDDGRLRQKRSAHRKDSGYFFAQT